MLRDGKDLADLGSLDPKLWVALAMPTRGVHLDARTLDLIDADKDGRVRLPEIVEAARWAVAALVNPDDLTSGRDTIRLDAIADPALRSGAKRILVNVGKPDADAIALADLADTAKIFSDTTFNGDGVVPADAATDPATRQIIEDVIATHGAVADRSGKPGVDQARLDAFFAEVESLAAWQNGAAAVQVLGPQTATAADATRAVWAKVDDHFIRCQLASVDARIGRDLAGSDADVAALVARDLSTARDDIARLPLAPVGVSVVHGGIMLPLDKVGINPAWSDAIRDFATQAVAPLLGKTNTLSLDAWTAIKAKLAPYEAWWASKPVTTVDKLGPDRIAALARNDAKAATTDLVQRDLAVAEESAQVEAVEKLLRYHRDLFRLLNNFVNFSEFYARKGAVFQAGTLYLDGRGCNLCLEVADAGKHATLAALSGAYLAYCDCTRPGGEKLGIVAAFTDGDSEHLLVGRNGVFYDRQGRDWDATITKILTNPISVREAFWAPYKKVARLIEHQVGKRAAAADAESDKHLEKTAATVAEADKAKPPDKAPEAPKIDVGTVAAIGVAIGGIGAMVTGVLTAFFGLGAWMPLGILAVFLLISGPSMLMAFLKLRQRNLGPLLDANGWAINGRARINVPFGGALTDMASLPAGSERSYKDPYAEKSRPWGLIIFLSAVIALGIAWYLGRLDHLLPKRVHATRVFGDTP